MTWMGLALSYSLLLRASQLFAEDGEGVREVYCLRRGDIAFSRGDHQVFGYKLEVDKLEVDKLEVRFRGS